MHIIREIASPHGPVPFTPEAAGAPLEGDDSGLTYGKYFDALEATVAIEDVRQPLSLSGTARWNGEALGFATSLALVDLLWGQKGDVAVDLKSQPLNANFSGTIDPAGALSGDASYPSGSITMA